MSYGSAGSRYGAFRWGRATAVQAGAGGSQYTEPTADRLTAEEAYGSGLALASNADIEAGRADYPFDLFTNRRGALATRSGVPYLMQNVALRLVSDSQALLGDIFNVDTRADLSLAVERLVTDDDRVIAVEDTEIQLARGASNAIVVSTTVIAERAAHDAIFSIEPPASL